MLSALVQSSQSEVSDRSFTDVYICCEYAIAALAVLTGRTKDETMC